LNKDPLGKDSSVGCVTCEFLCQCSLYWSLSLTWLLRLQLAEGKELY